MKRLFALALCLACLCTVPALAAATTGSAKIGSKTGTTVTVSMHSGVTADIALANECISYDRNASEMLQAAAAKGNLIAAINGGYFNSYYGNGTLVDGYGAVPYCWVEVIRNGSVLNGAAGNGHTAVYLGFTPDGRAMIDEVAIALNVCYNGHKIPTWGVNKYYSDPTVISLFTPEAGRDLPIPAEAKAAKIVGGKVVEILEYGTMTCEQGVYWFVWGPALYPDLHPRLGDAVTFRTECDKSEWNNVVAAVSGYPWLLQNGRDVLNENYRLGYFNDYDKKVGPDVVLGRSFAAVLANGDLMLGTCTASPRQIMEYLLSVGAKDAVLLDGGASSMLWANGKTLTSAGRKLNNIVCIYDNGSVQPAPAEPSAPVAVASTQNVSLDGKAVEFQCYALRDANGNLTNYIKLRDLAKLLSGTAAQFEVGWDGSVNIVTHAAYTPNNSELSTPFSGDRAYQTSTAVTKIDGVAADLAAIALTDDAGGGYTYYKLRDLGKALDFNVGWSAERGMFVETDKPYTDAD